MLAERFEDYLAAQLELTEARNEESRLRDEFIADRFPVLQAAFSASVDAVTGNHSLLEIRRTTISEPFTDRGFASLEREAIELRSMLREELETVMFMPQLEELEDGQFGVIRVEITGFETTIRNGFEADLQRSILERGILMQGTSQAELAVQTPEGSTVLTDERLECLLAALLVRT